MIFIYIFNIKILYNEIKLMKKERNKMENNKEIYSLNK